MVSLPTKKSFLFSPEDLMTAKITSCLSSRNKTHPKECTFQIGKLLNCCAVVWFHIMTQLVNSFWMWLFAGGTGGGGEACYFSFDNCSHWFTPPPSSPWCKEAIIGNKTDTAKSGSRRALGCSKFSLSSHIDCLFLTWELGTISVFPSIRQGSMILWLLASQEML